MHSLYQKRNNLPNVIEIAQGPNKYRNMRKAYAAYFKSSGKNSKNPPGKFFINRSKNMRSLSNINLSNDQMKRSGSVKQLGLDGIGQYETDKIDGVRNLNNNKSTLQYRQEEAMNEQFGNPYENMGSESFRTPEKIGADFDGNLAIRRKRYSHSHLPKLDMYRNQYRQRSLELAQSHTIS